MSAVCVIPARGGSKRLPGKNIRPLHGKPLLLWTVDAVLGSGRFDAVYVSSDDERILEIAERGGALTDRRPPRLAGDTTRAVEVVAEFLERMLPAHGWDEVGMCLPTCPLRTAADVAEAVDRFRAGKGRCPRLVGVSDSDRPQLALRTIGEHLAEMREPEAYAHTTRSQDMERFYLPNGSIYLATVEEYLATGTFFGTPTLIHELPPERSFDIDHEYQFHLAECMLRYLEERGA
jgi:CMP-N-acetylneuraminic acid synthetase